MLNVLPFIIKNWRVLAVASAVAGAVGYVGYVKWQAFKDGKEECLNEVQIKELTHVVYVKQKQNAAAANRPAGRTAVIERLRTSVY